MQIKPGLMLLLACSLAAADDITIHSVTALPVPHTHNVLEPKLLTVKFDTPAPDETTASSTSKWFALCFPDSTSLPTPLTIRTAEHHGTADFTTTPTIILEFAEEATKNCDMVEVIFLTDTSPSQRWKKTKDKPPAPMPSEDFLSRLFAPAKGSGDPDYSISVTVVPAVGSGPLYSLDASAQPRIIKGTHALGFTATAKTDSSHKADLDSFGWSLDYRHFPGRFGEVVRPIGMEFNKTGDAMNVISGGSLVWTMFNTDIAGGKPKVSTALDLRVGIELGDNFKNSFTIVNHPSQMGSGFIFRGVPSARFALVIPTAVPKRRITLTSTYTVRLPARDELFLETRLHTKDPVPMLGTNPRHYLQNDLTFKVTDFFGFKFEHTYGSLPPSFKFSDHRGSVGIVFQAKQP